MRADTSLREERHAPAHQTPVLAAQPRGLAAHFGGWTQGLPFVIGLNIVQVVHVLWVQRGVRALEAQIRLLFLGVILLGSLPSLGIILVLPMAGIGLLLVFDYCIAARLLALMPWNREAPLSWPFVRRVFARGAPAGAWTDACPR
jgi:hypothetical protein